MTPERAAKLLKICAFTAGINAHSAEVNAILAACREERRAALTEAALHVDEAAQMDGLTHDQVIAIKGVVLSLLALRDKERP